MKKIYHRLANLGIYADTPFALRNKLTVFNNANIIVFLISLFYMMIGIRNGFYWGVTLTIYSCFSTSFSLYMVHRGWYRLAFHYILWYGAVFLSAFSILFGIANNSHYYFLFLPVVVNIFFDDLKVSVFYLVLCILIMLANVIYIDNCEAYYTIPKTLVYFGYPNIPFTCLLIFLGVRLFKQENAKYAGTIEEQRQTLEEKNREITDSINYAKKIQNALIPSEAEFNSHFNESFVVFKPKDIVSGDFYWVTRKDKKVFYATADCTGHGVPGGFMTMLGISFLDEIVNEKNVHDPAEVLNQLRDRIVNTLKQTGSTGENKDGMDMTLCCLDTETNMLRYAGANNSIYILPGGKNVSPLGEMPKAEGGISEQQPAASTGSSLIELKPDKQPVGYHDNPQPFTSNMLQLQKGDSIYTLSDGYADQFGGEKGKKFKYKNLEQLLLKSHSQFDRQKKLLEETFDNWKGNLEQVDDILLIGVRL